MESEPECDPTKTPRRTRRMSAMDTESISHHKRSTRKTVLAEIMETGSILSDDSNPVSPIRSVRELDFQTPSRSEGLASAQTPRRSVRKSIKPLQDYENIVAQKGLSTYRAASCSLEENDDKTEGKWEPAVIGRVSTKRGKRAKRTKSKQLQRQKRIAEEMAKEGVELVDENEDEAYVVNSQMDGEELLGGDKLHANDELDEDQHNSKNKDVTKSQHECRTPGENVVDVTTGDRKYDNVNKEDMKIEENQNTSVGDPCSEIHKDENYEDNSEASIEGGDIEMATMPVTADDCLESPEKPFHISADVSIKTRHLGVDQPEDRSNESDCIMLSFNESSHTEQSLVISQQKTESKPENSNRVFCDSAENNMPALLICSDDEEEFVDAPSTLTETKETELKCDEKLSEPHNEATTVLDSTFDADKSSTEDAEVNGPQTPLLRPSITRIPTPFKSNVAIVPDIVIETEEDLNANDTPDVVMDSKAEKIKSSRKRSFSVIIDRPKKVVTFHSPSNTIVSICSGDLLKVVAKKEPTNITQRRKRSISLTETDREVIAYFNNKKTPENTPVKQRKLPNPSSKTKMPNFAAIHQQQFQKMESISDHVARRAERAKILTSSAKKFKPSSIQKGFNVNNSVLREFNKDSAGNKSTNLPMPKARQRIELFGNQHTSKSELGIALLPGLKIRSKSKPDLSKLDDFQPTGKFSVNIKPKLPKPRFDLTANTLKAPLSQAASNKVTIPKAKTTNTTIAFGSHIESSLPDSRHKLNLSTAIETKPTERLEERRKRIMEMYKSRGAHRAGENRKEILKGVRTNRRFELQMQCRNRLN